MTLREKRWQLGLHEELMLLCLQDEKGTVISPKTRFGIAGAIAAELLLQDVIRIDDSRRRELVEAHSSRWMNDPVLNDCLQAVRAAKRRAQLRTWVMRFANVGKLEHRVAARLCERGILREAESKLLLIFKRKIYPEIDPGPERAVIERLRAAIFTDARDISPRTAVLTSLANHTELLHPIFSRKELKARRTRLKELAKGNAAGQATQQAIAAVQAAVIAAAAMQGAIAGAIAAS